MGIHEEFLSRTPLGAKDAREIIVTALSIADAVREKADGIRSDRWLSKAGVSAKLIEMGLGGPWSHLQQQRDKAKAMATDIASARARMSPPQPDPTNFAQVILNSELRTVLRTSTRADRLRLARDDNAFALAALTAHPALSGFVEELTDDLDIVRTVYQQRNFTELFAGIELRDEAMSSVNAAIETATRQILNEIGIAETEVGRLTMKADSAEIDPDNLPKITRQELKEWSISDPGRAAGEMKRVYEGKAQLVD